MPENIARFLRKRRRTFLRIEKMNRESGKKAKGEKLAAAEL